MEPKCETWNAKIERLRLQVEKIKKLAKIFQDEPDPPFKFRISGTDWISIEISTLEDAMAMRKIIRRLVVGWKESLTNIFTISDNRVVVCWAHKYQEHDFNDKTAVARQELLTSIQLHLVCPIDEFPEELKKPSCSFVETTTPPSTCFSYVCQKPKEPI